MSYGHSDLSLHVNISRFSDSDNYTVSAINKEGTNIIMKITNDTGDIIFTEMFHAVEQFYKIYNLSTLPKGKYNIHISNNSENTVQEISVNQLKGSHPDLGKNLVVGFSKVKELKISAVIQNKSKSNVEVALYTSSDQKIKVLITTKEEISRQSLNLSTLKPGNYKLKISDGKSVYCRNLIIG